MRLSSLAAVCSLLLTATTAYAAASIVPNMNYRSSLRVSPFSTLSQPQFSWITGATVTIDVNYMPGYDQLFFEYEGKSAITGSFNTVNGVLYLSGLATSSDYTEALASVVFYTTSAAGARRQITYALGENTFFFPLTTHYYQFNSAPGVTWNAAAARCSASSYFNLTGYLTTVTTANEQNSLGGIATFDAWIGGNDVQTFGSYTWVAGPETGNLIWAGQSLYAGGATPEYGFSAWDRFQPENPLGSGQDYMYLVNSVNQKTAYWAVATDRSFVGGYICEYGGPGQTMPVSGGSVELIYSCDLFTTPGDCAAESAYGCVWSSSTNQCVQGQCPKYLTQQSCVSDAECLWDVSSDVGLCVATGCASLSAAMCPTNPQCIVDSDGVTCRPAFCSERTTACSCNMENGCLWRNGLCGNVSTVDCNGMDIVFLVDASAIMANPYGHYTQGFFGITEALRDTDYYFNGDVAGTTYQSSFAGTRVGIATFGMPSVGLGSGTNGRLTSDRQQWEADITSLQQSYTPLPVARNIRDALVVAQNMFDAAPNRTRVVVILAAGAIADALTLQSDLSVYGSQSLLGVFKALDISIIGGAIESASTTTTHSVLAQNSLSLLTDATTDILSSTITELTTELFAGMCMGTALSNYLTPGKVSLLCSALTDPTSCNFNLQCAWDPSGQVCNNNLCLSYCDAESCSQNEACGWLSASSTCVSLCPTLGQAQCLVTPTCNFDYPLGQCNIAPCVTNPSEDACIADTFGCTWFSTNATPCQVTPCQAPDAASCAGEPGCAFNGIECVYDFCPQLLTPEQCATLPQCEWSLSKSLCQRNLCGMYATQSQCSSNYDCVWNMSISPAACGPRMCTSFNQNSATAQVLCEINSDQCLWQTTGSVPRCVVKTCEMMTTSCDCANLDGCLWRNQTCQTDTFTQCPPTDVVFLVEATPVMNEAFGRHPSGYVGIIEAIREWSSNAPFASSAASPGFRFALVEYGQNLPLNVPVGIGGGGNLTTSSNEWVGAGQELDWNEANEPTYATSVQAGTVALRPALQQAINIFSNSYAPNRKQIVVVLGNSPITDGGSAMLQQLNTLESMGIKIFVNVIRRFTYITDLDLIAQTFLQPIASHPPTTFFSFNTIDTMTASLLDNFCDPASSTGIYLGVSMDGELPCSWLTGSDQCNIQGACLWNSTATTQCPQADECPTLGCTALPATLANLYTCDQCQLISGAISCSRANPPPPQIGLCQIAQCAQTCEADCSASTSCDWISSSVSCERKMCSIYADQASCDTQSACVWQDLVAPASCQRSVCGRLRAATSCSSVVAETNEGYVYSSCFFNTTVTPAVCMEYRCPSLTSATCAATSICTFDSSHNFCAEKVCQYATQDLCDVDASCYWDWFNGVCNERSVNCILAPYSDWAPCSATCGNAYTYKTRAIMQFPNGGSSCAAVASSGCYLTNPALCAKSDTNMTVIASCTAPTVWTPPNPNIPAGAWPMDCTAHCMSYTSRLECTRDSSCMWSNEACVVTQYPGCQAYQTPSACAASDMCAWDTTYNICGDAMNVCPYQTSSSCSSVSICNWHTGSSAISLAASLGQPLQLFNPGQAAIFPFSSLTSTDTTIVTGATVSIESNYQFGKDQLQATFTNKTVVEWIEASGLLVISGAATVAEYMKTIRYVTFSTTSTSTNPRTLTWSLGNGTVYCSSTGHSYRFISNPGASYSFALADCSRRSLFGLQGYLATVTSQNENDVISTKLFADGWISGGDSSSQLWTYSSGPEATSASNTFWFGPSASLGGYPVGQLYSNWAPPNASNIYGEPITSTTASGSMGSDRVYLSTSGYWVSKSLGSVNTDGYICEFGGLSSDVTPAFSLGGSLMIGIGGCVAQNCVWHNTEEQCNADVECSWQNGQCQLGCNAFVTQADCTGNPICYWDTSSLPAYCAVEPCASLAMNQCLSNSQCSWSSNTETCALQQGCGILNSQVLCQNTAACYWSDGVCLSRGCATFTSVSMCQSIPKCRWDDSTESCADQYCMYATPALCTSDPQCLWNSPQDSRVLAYSPSIGYAYPFQSNVDPCNDVQSTIGGITIAITSGFQANMDTLSIDPSVQAANNYVVVFNPSTGVMLISANVGTAISCSAGFAFLSEAVRFSTTSTSVLQRTITYALNSYTVFSIATQTYYTWLPQNPSSFSAAVQTCAATTWFGLQGSLAVLQNEGDAELVAQLGLPGWIAASSDSNGMWSWTLPSGATVPFWNGTGPLGTPLATTTVNGTTSTTFSLWDIGQPSIPSSYGYVATSGYWKAVLPGSSSGIFCAFGSVTQRPSAVVGGFRLAVPAGCFLNPCSSLTVSQCGLNGQCTIQNNLCVTDTRCQAAQSISQCGNLALCYWDFNQGACLSQMPDQCSNMNYQSCLNYTQICQWNPNLFYSGQSSSGFCVARGCAAHPSSSPCMADPLCTWSSTSQSCTARLCGYSTQSQCWADSLCMYQNTPSAVGCTRSPCAGYTQSTCAAQGSMCSWSGSSCVYVRCTSTDRTTCLQDSACIYLNGQCQKPACNSSLTQAACSALPNCYFSVSMQSCTAAQCVSFTSQSDCSNSLSSGSLKSCVWQNGNCRDPTYAEEHAAASNSCVQQVNGNMWWLWLFLVIILILLGMILHRLYLAHAGRANIFEPTRRNYKYNPHERYAASLIADSKNRINGDSINEV